MLPTTYYVALSAILFTIGALGVLIRRNAILIFMSVELIVGHSPSLCTLVQLIQGAYLPTHFVQKVTFDELVQPFFLALGLGTMGDEQFDA